MNYFSGILMAFNPVNSFYMKVIKYFKKKKYKAN